MGLEITMPNVGDGKTEYVHCPNCSKMYMLTNSEGESQTLPANCSRCRCPVEDSAKARRFMDEAADREHQPALAAMGRRSRGETAEVPA